MIISQTNVVELTIKPVKGEGRVDSRLIAPELGIQHRNLTETIRKYQQALEQFGSLPFKTEARKRKTTGGVVERYALLNEDQAVFLMTLSRNTEQVVRLKARLVMAFRRFRDHQQSEADYLPFYHSLHDTVKELADSAHQAGSNTAESIFHINVNRLINQAFNLQPGDRQTLPHAQRVYVSTAQLLVRDSLHQSLTRGLNHRQAYAEAKRQLADYIKALPTNAAQLSKDVA